MFDGLHTSYSRIVTSVAVIGYSDEDIKTRGVSNSKNLPLKCLYAYPNFTETGLNSFIYQMMFPDNNHKIPSPKFFSLSLINQQGTHFYLYCLKFSEKYYFNNNEENEQKDIDVPIVICVKSEKEDLESFKQLLHLINFIIFNDESEKDGFVNYEKINNFKKVQLINLIYFLFTLPHLSPHSILKLILSKEIKNSPTESIDFYFSSNCEIPCNKNDTDINVLFLLLDQSVIIKTLFSILTEKQIVFRASQAFLLHIIIPTFLKLIFPFKWMQSCITVLPKENLDLLEAPGAFIFGVLSNVISLKDLIEEYPGKIVIDCDTNEIFGDSYFEPYEPPKYIPTPNMQDDKKNKKEKNKKENNVQINNSNYITQGNNIINVCDSYLYKYDGENGNKKIKLNYKSKKNIIVDVQQSQLLIDKSDIFMDSLEWKWLRRNLQLVRNPEIFDLENIGGSKDLVNNVYFSDEDEENIILPNRPFSYNIQNIIMQFLLNKISFSESEFMTIFKNTSLYLFYNDPKKYQNNSGKKIVENIFETKNNQRTIDNSFNIEYSLPNFNTHKILPIIENLNPDDKENENINKLKNIFENYNQLINENEEDNIFNAFEEIYENRKTIMVNKDSIGSTSIKSDFKKTLGRLSKFVKTHEKNKTSLLQETYNNSHNFVLYGADKTSKHFFQFYGADGFLDFMKNFGEFLLKEKIDIIDELYGKKIHEQMTNIILNIDDFFDQNIRNKNSLTSNTIYNITNNSTNNTINSTNNNIQSNTTNNIQSNKNSYISKKKVTMSIIPEKLTEEDKEEDLLEGRGTVNILNNNCSPDYDFATDLMSNISLNMNKYNIQPNQQIDNELYDNKEEIISDDIISFILADDYEINKNSISNINDKINHKVQYYIFITQYLEKIKIVKEKLDNFIESVEKCTEIKNFDINSFIIKIYKIAYKLSGIKHRDFPYFSYYSFLRNIKLDDLKNLSKSFEGVTLEEGELYEIYQNVKIEEEKILFKKQKKLKKKNKEDKKKDDDSSSKKKDLEKKSKHNLFNKKVNPNEEKDLFQIAPIDMNDIFDNTNTIRNINYPMDNNKKEDSNIIEFNQLFSYAINSTNDFDCINKKEGHHIINSIAKEIISIFPKTSEIYQYTPQKIVENMHKEIIKNKNLFNMIGQLKYLDISKLTSVKERLCFWLNCFNFLLLFTIFYRKWNINTEKDWKYFFKNVKYDIGGVYFSFNDIMYVIYKKPLFFPSSYKTEDNLKKFRVDKTDDAKNYEKKHILLYNPFLLYLPNRRFFRPIIYEEHELDDQIENRIKFYISSFVYVDKDNNIVVPELLTNYQPNFLYRGLKKVQKYVQNYIYNYIKEKKYKSVVNMNMNWYLSFDYLLEDKINNPENIS